MAQKLARGSLSAIPVVGDRCAVIFSRLPERSRWMENELMRSGTHAVSASSVAQLVSLLTEPDRTRPPLVVIDLDALTAGELFHLHRIREQGWGGSLFALGRVPMSLRSSMGIDRALPPPFVEDALCEEVVQHREDSKSTTVPIPLP
jgi:hypothetical protein